MGDGCGDGEGRGGGKICGHKNYESIACRRPPTIEIQQTKNGYYVPSHHLEEERGKKKSEISILTAICTDLPK